MVDIGLVVPPEMDANTLSGLFLNRLARMPEEGDVIDEPGFTLRVLAVEDRHVARVAIRAVESGVEDLEDASD